jgi:hypothetical protein
MDPQLHLFRALLHRGSEDWQSQTWRDIRLGKQVSLRVGDCFQGEAEKECLAGIVDRMCDTSWSSLVEPSECAEDLNTLVFRMLAKCVVVLCLLADSG